MIKNQRGYIEDWIAPFFILIGIVFFAAILCISFKGSDEVVSGIAYNTKNDGFFTGNTTFSIRAGENTPVTEENKSSYCLPPNSPYKDLVNKAAEDKRIKIVVKAKKYFAIKAPWTCQPNVTVTEVK